MSGPRINFSSGVLNHGFLRFHKSDPFWALKPFIFCQYSCAGEEVLQMIRNEWKLEMPLFALVIISEPGALGEWPNRSQLDRFKKGLIQAASGTKMWILCSGMNMGISKEIGDAVSVTMAERRALKCPKHPGGVGRQFPITLMGVCSDQNFANKDPILTTVDKPGQTVDLEDPVHTNLAQELNQGYSHYLFINDTYANYTGFGKFIMEFEKKLAPQIIESTHSPHPTNQTSGSPGGASLPVIHLLVHGDHSNARLICERLNGGLPVVVLQGTGGLADLIAYVNEEVTKHKLHFDADYVEEYVKPELENMIVEAEPRYKRDEKGLADYRNYIIDIVRVGIFKQKGQPLTLINTRSPQVNLAELDEFLLKALLRYQGATQGFYLSQLRRDLLLTFDWNCVAIAKKEFLDKVSLSELHEHTQLFTKALCTQNKEEFVSLFLQRGFPVDAYLTRNRLIHLYTKALENDIFKKVCWEGVLGCYELQSLDSSFLPGQLNTLVEKLSGIRQLIRKADLDPTPDKDTKWLNPTKAMLHLILWAAFCDRRKLIEILWIHSGQPIHLALTIVVVFENMMPLMQDANILARMTETKESFTKHAVACFTKSYHESCCRAMDILSARLSEYGGKSAIEIAADGNILTFVAHPCCQRWITDFYKGGVFLRGESGATSFGLGAVIKVLLSAFLVFPMFYFMSFQDAGLRNDSSVQSGGGDGIDSPGARYPAMDNEQLSDLPQTKTQKIIMFWNSARTKFYIHKFMFLLYLILSALGILQPGCGSRIVDTVVLLFTTDILFQYVVATYVKYKEHQAKDSIFRIIIAFVRLLMIVALLFRLTHVFILITPYGAKVILSIGLQIGFYEYIIRYEKSSPTLGPQLLKAKLMVTQDFTIFFRILLVVAVADGLVVHALLNPDYPLGMRGILGALHRAFIALFITPISDAFPDKICDSTKRESNVNEVCEHMGGYSDYTCPTTGFSYAVLFYHIMLCKLILMTLLLAMFSNTCERVDKQADQVWKFQRYENTVEFTLRVGLPPPLSIISYIVRRLCFKYVGSVKAPTLFVKRAWTVSESEYWKHLVDEYWTAEQDNTTDETREKETADKLSLLTTEIEIQRTVFRKLQSQVKDLRRAIRQSKFAFEELKSAASSPESGKTKHALSKTTPYPKTQVNRLHVPDRFTSWTVEWPEYEPIIYTKSKYAFPKDQAKFVDDFDPLRATYMGMRNIEVKDNKLPEIQWNTISKENDVSVDRRTWVVGRTDLAEGYMLENEVPKNPTGRTGLRGKGALLRWGPNHYVHLIVSRLMNDSVFHIGGKGLEVFLYQANPKEEKYTLPGSFVLGEQKYTFLEEVFNLGGEEPPNNLEALSEFFARLAKPRNSADATMLSNISFDTQKTYMDDPLNTDNAWKECEAVFIHYPPQVDDNFSTCLKPNFVWVPLKSNLYAKLPASEANLLMNGVQTVHAQYEANATPSVSAPGTPNTPEAPNTAAQPP